MKKNLTIIWNELGSARRRQFALLFALMVIASFAEILSLGAIVPFLGALTAPDKLFFHPYLQPAIRSINLKSPAEIIRPITALFVSATVFAAFVRLLLLKTQTDLAHTIGADLSLNVYRRTLFQPYSVHVRRNSSEVVAGISTKINDVIHWVVLPTLRVASSAVIMVALIFTLFAINRNLTIVALLGFSVIYALVLSFTRRRLLANSHRINQRQTEVIKELQEGLGSIRDILLDGAQSIYCERFRRIDIPLRKTKASNEFIGESPRYIIESLSMIMIVVLAAFLSFSPRGVMGALPEIGALAFGAQKLLPTMQQIYRSLSSIRAGRALLDSLIVLLSQPLPPKDDVRHPKALNFSDKIIFDQVGFFYDDPKKKVLDSISLEIPKASRIGFVGSTGSGKSTLLDVFMGLLVPTSGSLKVDNISITDSNRQSWQRNIAHVPQSIFLSDATIAENIAFGVAKEDVDRERVRDAALRADIASTIESWENAYDTIVGERGVRLSGGQRQRIGIARALYRGSEVIVLDEATSALDNDTEHRVMDSFGHGKSRITVLMVAHRLSSLRGCDMIYELSFGKLVRRPDLTRELSV